LPPASLTRIRLEPLSPHAVAVLTPGSGHSLRIGDYTGVLYYSVEAGGYRVVATIAQGEAGMPVRFLSVLGDGQKMTISVPGREGQAENLVEVARTGDRLLVGGPANSDQFMTT